ncbi:hypothetical protein BpHYR1_019817 [Brachionus plicatilis]|uniref:Uncharacterized protein n=1 Tax=Brachionus plicatilis TaxID=10195 RepID=A0A3M7RXC0_BRAPC|nr:hypothetical protein BpHYR1_019817 [Brachionus plicatilis]
MHLQNYVLTFRKKQICIIKYINFQDSRITSQINDYRFNDFKLTINYSYSYYHLEYIVKLIFENAEKIPAIIQIIINLKMALFRTLKGAHIAAAANRLNQISFRVNRSRLSDVTGFDKKLYEPECGDS